MRNFNLNSVEFINQVDLCVTMSYGPGIITSMPTEALSSAPLDINMNGNVYCRRCRHGGCDVKLIGCGCSAHAVSSKATWDVL